MECSVASITRLNRNMTRVVDKIICFELVDILLAQCRDAWLRENSRGQICSGGYAVRTARNGIP